MNNKVLIKLYVPEVEEQYDVRIPLNKRICNIIPLLVKSVKELTNGYYNPKEVPRLYDKLSSREFILKDTVKSANIKNGTEIILI